jgi:hypothetical protein
VALIAGMRELQRMLDADPDPHPGFVDLVRETERNVDAWLAGFKAMVEAERTA